MDKQKNIKNIREHPFERVCKLYGKCCNQHENHDSSHVSLFGLHCLNKKTSGAS